MTTTTTGSMNILIEKPSVMISAKVPGRMKYMMGKAAAKLNVNFSQYMKLAIKERLEKDI